MHEHRISVRRTARYFTRGARPDEAREVWFVIHGYGQLAADFLGGFDALDDGSRLLVAPEGLSRFYIRSGQGTPGASWMTREAREAEIDDYVAYLDAVYDAIFGELDRDRVRVRFLGFSQGTATTSRWLALGHARVDRLILWAGDVAQDLDLTAHGEVFRSADLTMVLGSEDEYISPKRMAAEEARLQAHDIPYRLLRFTGNHRLDDALLRTVAAETG